MKARYGLWVTPAEHAAIARVLATCPGQRIPTEAGAPPVTQPAPRTSSQYVPPPTHTTTAAPPPPPAPVAKTYANCTAMHVDYPHAVGLPGAVDHTSGEPDTEFYVSTALYEANRKSDRDGDGIACEH